MKTEYHMIEETTIEDFAERYDLVMEVHERQNTTGNRARFYAFFKRSDVLEGSCTLVRFSGNGATPQEAIDDYAQQISLRTLIVDAMLNSRREIRVPRLCANTQWHHLLAMAEERDACAKGLAWARKHGPDAKEIPYSFAEWALDNLADLLTPEQINRCALVCPVVALTGLADRLTPDCLDACAKAAPAIALSRVAHRLTPERLDACAEKEPGVALVYVPHLLTPKRRALCEK